MMAISSYHICQVLAINRVDEGITNHNSRNMMLGVHINTNHPKATGSNESIQPDSCVYLGDVNSQRCRSLTYSRILLIMFGWCCLWLELVVPFNIYLPWSANLDARDKGRSMLIVESEHCQPTFHLVQSGVFHVSAERYFGFLSS